MDDSDRDIRGHGQALMRPLGLGRLVAEKSGSTSGIPVANSDTVRQDHVGVTFMRLTAGNDAGPYQIPERDIS